MSLDGRTTLFDVAKENRIYLLDSDKDVSELVRKVFGTLPQGGRNVGGGWSQGWRFVVGDTELTANQEAIADKYGIDDLSENFSNPYYKQILAEIRKLTIEAIERATRNKKSKKEILLLWDKVREQAEQNDYLGLEESRDELLKLAGKQKRGENASLIREAKKEIRDEIWGKVKRTLKIWTVVVLFFVSVSFSLLYSFSGKTNLNQPKSNSIKTEQSQIKRQSKQIISEQDIINAISKYNQIQSKGNQIYQWRKQKIIEALRGKQMTKQELDDTIKVMARSEFWKVKR